MRRIILIVISILLSLSGKCEVVLESASCIAYIPGVGPVLSATVTTTTPGALYMWTSHAGALSGPYLPTSWTGSTALFDLSAMGIDSIGVTCDTFYFHYDSVSTSVDPKVFAQKTIICPCPIDSTPIYRPGCLDFVRIDGVMHQIVKIKCNVNAANSYLWYPAGGTASIAMLSITYNTFDNDYDVVFDLTAAGIGITTDCHHFTVNYVNVDPFPANDLLICPCDTNIYPPMPSLDSGCIAFDKKGHQIITLYTNYTGSGLFMWVNGIGAVPQTGGVPGVSATFDLNTFGLGINITMECHDFYFNTVPTDPFPSNSIKICPCGDSLTEPIKCNADFTYCQSTSSPGYISFTPNTIPTGATQIWVLDSFNHFGSGAHNIYMTPGSHLLCNFVSFENGDNCNVCIELCVNKPFIYSDGGNGTKRREAIQEVRAGLLNIFPNPTQNSAKVVFTIPENSDVVITVYNAVGQLVNTINNSQMRAGEQSVEINTSALPTGVYTVRLKTNKLTTSSQLSVIK